MKHLTQIEEKVPQGTSPFIIDSTTVVPNLNADQLDGKHASDFSLSTHNHNETYQPIDADLTAIAGLTGTTGLLKKTAANTWVLDTSTYSLSTHTHLLSAITDVTATAVELNVLDGITSTVTELNYTDGVTSNIQTQLDAKLASSAYTASDVLTKIKTVDGSGSGLDADTLDGQHGSYYLDWTNVTNKPDPIITLIGDVTGSVTLTDLASGTLTATVVDDSHNHIISNIDGLQVLLDDNMKKSIAMSIALS